MKICPKCKKELADDVKFCTGCGYKLDETVSDAHKTSEAHLNEDKNYSKWVFVIGICVFIVVAACFYFKICLKQDTGQEIMEQEQEQEQKQRTILRKKIFLIILTQITKQMGTMVYYCFWRKVSCAGRV